MRIRDRLAFGRPPEGVRSQVMCGASPERWRKGGAKPGRVVLFPAPSGPSRTRWTPVGRRHRWSRRVVSPDQYRVMDHAEAGRWAARGACEGREVAA